ncbi:MAG TPA: sugar phosphate isomerase/epimerase family protein, partial [Phycisphaerae bacterium]|nr:sugar phosphate isomerase/epimerase family protein [Phycisphaerae bacterium]
FASSAGFDCVELMCWPVGKAERRYAGVSHVNVTGLDAAGASRIRGLVGEAGISISGLGYYPNPLTPNQAEAAMAIEHLHRVIDGAKLLGVGVVNTFIGRDWTKSVDENWPRFLEVFRELVNYAGDAGIKLCIENCPMLSSKDEWPGGKNLAISPAIWRRMFNDIPNENFGLNYDPSHMIWLHMDYLKPLREFKDRIFHVHAKDVRLDKHRLDDVGILAYPPQYFTHKLPGLGDVDWGRFFSVLTDTGYGGPVCIEVEDRAYEGGIDLRQASLVQSGRYLANFAPFMQRGE